MRKIASLFGLAVLLCLGPWGCTSTDTVYSANYWGRHIQKVSQDFHEFRIDLDRVVFGFEDRPVEDDYK